MREILFRAQTRKLGEKVRIGDGAPVPGHWVYGGILQGNGDRSIIYAIDENGHFDDKYPVHSDTVGQFTGMTDMDGRKIFEGDLINFPGYKYLGIGCVEFEDGIFRVNCGVGNDPFLDDAVKMYGGVVVGNIHDNPELMEVATNDT